MFGIRLNMPLDILFIQLPIELLLMAILKVTTRTWMMLLLPRQQHQILLLRQIHQQLRPSIQRQSHSPTSTPRSALNTQNHSQTNRYLCTVQAGYDV